MNDNGIPMSGPALYTVEETRLAMEWREKALALEAKYKDDLAEAGNDEDKKRAIIKLIYDEVGPVPIPIQVTMSAGLPIVIEISKYQKEVEKAARISVINPDGSWTCGICKSRNTGNYCNTCGNERPE